MPVIMVDRDVSPADTRGPCGPGARFLWIAGLVALAGMLAAGVSRGSGERPNAGIVWAAGGGILGASADGSGKHVMARDPLHPDYYYSPAWSRSGRVLAFTTCASDSCAVRVHRPATGRSEVVAVGVGDRSDRRVFVRTVDPSWAPGDGHLAVTDMWGYRRSTIWVVALKTDHARRLTPPGENRRDYLPAWSPAGGTIAFVRQAVRGGAGQAVGEPLVYLIGVDGSRERLLTRGTSPSWSPDGSALVLASGDGIYRIRSDGGGRRRIATVARTRGDDIHPRWSPDGRKILFERREPDSSWSLWVMDADGSDGHRVLTGLPSGSGFSGLDPAWRPG